MPIDANVAAAVVPVADNAVSETYPKGTPIAGLLNIATRSPLPAIIEVPPAPNGVKPATSMLWRTPKQLALTFERHEKHHHATIGSFLSRSGNVAQVFDVDYYPAVGRIGKLPEHATVNVKQ